MTMRYDRPIARLSERFPVELNVRKMMDAPLELRFHRQRVILSRLEGGTVLCEVEEPTNTRAGHGWSLIVQLQLENEHLGALHSYLSERLSEKV
jgi:hypothetical protein